VRGRIAAAWDWLLGAEKTAGVRAALQAVDADPYRDEVRDAVRADDGEKIAALAGRAAALEQPPEFTAFLGGSEAIGVGRRRQLLEAAVRRRPGDLGLLMALGLTYPWGQEEGSEQRLRWYQAAVAAAPTNPAAHYSLGAALNNQKDLAGAEAAYRQALRLDPKYSLAHNGLGAVLRDRKDLAGAEAACREALRLEPMLAVAHISLGNVLCDRQDLAGAEAAYREALRLDPTLVPAYNNLGWVLQGKGDLAGAEAAYLVACLLDSKLAPALNGLGSVLRARRDPAAAEAAYRKALRLDPKSAPAHIGLGNVLRDRRDLAGAEAAYREALRLDPTLVPAYNNLGWVLQGKGDLEGAVAEFKEALRLDPKNSYALANLPRAERMRALLPRLPAVLAGQAEPETPDEACALARLCAPPFQQRYAAAARLFDRAFTADPKLAADLQAGHRYNAACYAALAADGQGTEPLPDKAVVMLRRQALRWLRDDLALYVRAPAPQDVRERLAQWQQDSDLASVRDPAALDRLPDDERQQWRQLWDDVAALLRKVEATQ
jgi:tetratricopeptide (TPR) repeat protein